MPILIHTDGGCRGNPGPGAWAYVLRRDQEPALTLSGTEPATTNNKMELQAVIEALERVQSQGWAGETIEIRTDSQYVKNGITAWIRTWKANGWRTADKKPVKNQELWRELEALNQALAPRWAWVKGHAGHPDNELCDQLANQAMDQLTQSIK